MDLFHKKARPMSPREIVSSTSCAQRCLSRLKCCNHNEAETFGHLTNTSTPAFTCKFHQDALEGQLLAVADEEGSLVLRDCRKVLGHEDSWLIGIGAHRNAIFDISWINGTNSLVTASADHSLKLWDMTTHKTVTTMLYHNASVKTVDVSPFETSIIASGGRDGLLNLWDLRYRPKSCGHHKPILTIRGAHSASQVPVSRKRCRNSQRVTIQPSQEGNVTAVKFVGEYYVASAGTNDGCVKIWDKRKLRSTQQQHSPVHTFTSKNEGMRKPGFTSLVQDTHNTCLYAVGTDSLIYRYDTLCFRAPPTHILSGHSCLSFYVKAALSLDNRFLLCGSSCSNAFIWDLEEPYSRPYVLSGHTKEVTCVAWSPKIFDLIATCSDDTSLRLWRPGSSPLLHNAQTPCACIGECSMYSGDLHTRGKSVMESSTKQSIVETPQKENTPPLCEKENLTCTPTTTSAKKSKIAQRSLHSYFGLSKH